MMTRFYDRSLKAALTGTAAAVILAACGGGGGGSESPPPLPSPTGGNGGGTNQPTFQAGQFARSQDFKNQCAVVRNGVDIDGNPWPDQAGTDLEERYWLRSWSDELYLWYDEITDTDPATYDTKFDHFDALRTTRTTASGRDVDQFHFFNDTEDDQRRRSGGPTVSYGASYALIETRTPRDVRVAYTFDDAASAGLERGAEILFIDGVDVVNDGTQAGVDVINAGLFPNAAGESYVFTIRAPGETETRDVTVTAAEVVEPPVLTTRTFDVADGNGGTKRAGYVLLNTFGNREAEGALFDAFTDFQAQGVEELFVDLRYNGGGFLDVSAQLAYMIAGAGPTRGRQYDALIFNDKHPTVNPVTGRTLTPTPFHDETLGFDPDLPSGRALPTLNLSGVSILSTSRTCSASEALINGLAGVDVDVNLIGGTTCGKPYGFYPTENCGTTWYTVQFRGANDKGFGDYADGLKPVQGATARDEIAGCFIADDFGSALGNESEAMLATAITRRTTGECPAVESAEANVSAKAFVRGGEETAIANTPELRLRRILETTAIRR